MSGWVGVHVIIAFQLTTCSFYGVDVLVLIRAIYACDMIRLIIRIHPCIRTALLIRVSVVAYTKYDRRRQHLRTLACPRGRKGEEEGNW